MRFLLILILFGLSSPAFSRHFIDEVTKDPIIELDYIWYELYDFYGTNLPEVITIKYHDDRFSGFEPPTKIWISTRIINDQSKFFGVVKHELSHLGLFQMTKGASYTNQFRFIDEGLADLLRYETIERIHRNQCNLMARLFLSEGRISLEEIMIWDIYFGDPFGTGVVDSRAYNIGSNFLYFLIDSYGKNEFLLFIRKINPFISMKELVLDHYKKDLAQLELEWINYILRN